MRRWQDQAYSLEVRNKQLIEQIDKINSSLDAALDYIESNKKGFRRWLIITHPDKDANATLTARRNADAMWTGHLVKSMSFASNETGWRGLYSCADEN